MAKLPRAVTWIVAWLAALQPVPAAPPRATDAGDDQYQFLVGLLEKGMTEMAVREAIDFLRQRPDHRKAVLARYRLGTALFELERFEEAAAALRVLAGRRGFDYEAEVCFRLGQCELALGRAGAAEPVLARVLELDADYLRTPAAYLLADAALRAGRHADAEARFEAVLSAEPRGEYAADARAGSAWCALRLERFEDAAARAREYLRSHAEAERADELWLVLGEALAGAGRPREALEAYAAVRAGEWADGALRGVGFARAQLGEHVLAAEAFAELRRRFPGSRFAAEARLQEGVARVRAGDAEAARRALEPAAGERPDAELLYWRARAHELAGDDGAALRALDEALRADPGDELAGRVQAARGDALTALGRSAEAVEAYGRAGSDYALHAAAVASLDEGRVDEAVGFATHFLEYCGESPYAPATRLALGEALLRQERHDVAAETFRAAAAGTDDPELAARALARVGWCEYLAGDAAAAAATFARVAQSGAAEAEEALYMQGRAALDAGDARAAERAWRAHRARHPDGARGADVLLELAALATDDAAAARDLRELLGRFPASDRAPRARYLLAERLEASGDAAGAAEQRAALIAERPGDPLVAGAAYALAFARFEAGDLAAAGAALDTALAADPAPALRTACLELRVWCQREGGDEEAALRAFAELAGLEPPEDRLWAAARAVVDLLRERDRAELAARLLDQLAESLGDPDARAAARVERAFLALDGGDVDDAERRVRALLREGPASPAVAEACFFTAEARFAAGAHASAAELYRAAFEVEGSSLRDRALYKGGFAALEAGDLETAQARFERLIGELPASELAGESRFLAGECAYRRGRHEEAAALLRQVLEATPRHAVVPRARFRLGLALGHLERWEECDRVLAELARRHADFEHLAEAELWRGRALAGLGRARPAEQALRRVIATDGGALAARARNELGELALAAGDRETALAEFLKVAVLYDLPDEVGAALLLAGETLEALGDPDRARRQYEELLERYPDGPCAGEARRRARTLGTF